MSSYLITGASRGLGLSLTKLLAERPVEKVRFIAATARTKTPGLAELTEKYPGRVAFIPLEVTKEESIKAAVTEVEKALGPNQGLDVLVNNAGIASLTPGGVSEMQDLMSTLDVNVNGPQRVTTAFLPLLRKGSRKLVVNVSSTVGSLTLAKYIAMLPTPAYKISKTALNMLTLQWAFQYEKEGFTFMAISPGYLKTDLGGKDAHLPVEVGSKAVLDILDMATKEQNGKFLDIHLPDFPSEGGVKLYQGGEIPW
ncbi:hypothetical protein A1O1_01088 [Capronia coronata CBS 617.96]|uniref:NAD(P)-binding protein n=1 Tax=Capronia coronata CBS 617.96 TaxID=1182541 RepID=W9YTW7_9EURO|nr:uncharacterized protein A1O1_01088 [Capronia coronata CBS 617.96]EXJ95963.1 hypothetical protein A1O1_01088 [Capronia coronata CBS 617.96]